MLYDRAKYLIVSVDVPIVGQITGSESRDALSVPAPRSRSGRRRRADAGSRSARRQRAAAAPALSLSSVTPELLDAAIRLVRLLDGAARHPDPRAARRAGDPVPAAAGEQASKLRQIAFAESKLQQVNRAIGWIKRNFREPSASTPWRPKRA